MTSKIVHFMKLNRMPILQQLHLEESLLRADQRNWCLFNSDIEHPAAVLGISASVLWPIVAFSDTSSYRKVKDVLHVKKTAEQGMSVIRRFTGGGTVVIDKNVLLVTLIFQKDLLPHVEPFPRPIMKWTAELYSSIFSQKGDDFQLRENDYAFGHMKFGGNAQSIVKNRWLHHTSFLWDIDHRHMAVLKQPPRQPIYRQNRGHSDFLCTLKHRLDSKEEFIQLLKAALEQQRFTVKLSNVDGRDALNQGIKLATKVLSLEDVE